MGSHITMPKRSPSLSLSLSPLLLLPERSLARSSTLFLDVPLLHHQGVRVPPSPGSSHHATAEAPLVHEEGHPQDHHDQGSDAEDGEAAADDDAARGLPGPDTAPPTSKKESKRPRLGFRFDSLPRPTQPILSKSTHPPRLIQKSGKSAQATEKFRPLAGCSLLLRQRRRRGRRPSHLGRLRLTEDSGFTTYVKCVDLCCTHESTRPRDLRPDSSKAASKHRSSHAIHTVGARARAGHGAERLPSIPR